MILNGIASSCQQEASRTPFRLADESLVRLYMDIQIGELSLTGLDKPKADSLRSILFQRLETLYGMQTEQIQEEIRHLETDTDKMKWVLERAAILADSIP